MGYKCLVVVFLVLVAATVVWTMLISFEWTSTEPGSLKTFKSKDELLNFVSAKVKAVETDPLIRRFVGFARTPLAVPAPAEAAFKASEYSLTNIQVESVDEADIVKTDGQLIYVASHKGWISIIKAYPPKEMRVLSKINLNGGVIGLFIGKGRLIALIEEAAGINPLPEKSGMPLLVPYFPWRLLIKVFDVSAPEKPKITSEVTFEGNYISSRMIDAYVYVVLAHPVLAGNQTLLPRWATNGVWREISPSDVYYSDSIEAPSGYTLIVALDILNGGHVAVKSVLTGYASCMYMSRSNLYIALPVLDRFLGGWGRTEIYRISVHGLNIRCEAGGKVPGKVLNQFSMDEYEGYFRVATTTAPYRPFGEGMRAESNNVYVLDAEDLKVIGKIEGLAPGERIYSARFMGKRCYLVTFKKVDPLFTIDLSDPSSPKVLGALKIPGYSDYLHPYGEDYLIGIGKEATPAEEGDFAWYQGLKISLFDISDIEHPREVAKIIIGDRGTDSPALLDHHALLFDKRRSLLVIPILEARIFEEDYPRGRPPWIYGRPVFQGAYIFHISPEDGIVLRGRITHMEGDEINPTYEVERTLYIDEALYTISDGKIKANNLDNLSEICEVILE
ncbi:MAG: beta-propeller domain-containing protein [Candidatus Bathyarchaeia archaeon]